MFFKDVKMKKAIERGDTQRLREVLEAGGDPNTGVIVGNQYWRLIEYAIHTKNADAFKLLIEKNADIKPHDGDRVKLLYVVLNNKMYDVADIILEKHPECINDFIDGSSTCLDIFTNSEDVDSVVFLLERKADANIRDGYHKKPLYYAREKNNTELISLLEPVTEMIGDSPQKKTQKLVSAAEEWKKLSDDRIAHVMIEKEIGYKLTEIFNFKRRECTRLYQNLETKMETVETQGFDALSDKKPLEEALQELNSRGGKADPGSIGGLFKPRLTGGSS